jgi:hypothetical protein
MSKNTFNKPKAFKISVNTTYNAFSKILHIDEKFVGTYDYMGIAYFWSSEYKHTMRDLSTEDRRKVHNMWLDYNLDVSGTSDFHKELLNDFLNK